MRSRWDRFVFDVEVSLETAVCVVEEGDYEKQPEVHERWCRRLRHLDQLVGVLNGDGYRDARTLPQTCEDPETELRVSSYGLPLN